jgi:hypothetical protein
MRLAAVAAAWGTLATFYPYTADQHLDWAVALEPALTEAGAARSDGELRIALNHLLAGLQDGHARLGDANRGRTGVLPISLRRFGDRVVVTGGSAASLAGVEPGSELVTIDRVPARAAYDRVADQVSAATPGLRAHLAATYLGAGEPGELRWLRLRTTDGDELTRVVSLVSTQERDHTMRPVQPWPDTEVVPGGSTSTSTTCTPRAGPRCSRTCLGPAR